MALLRRFLPELAVCILLGTVSAWAFEPITYTMQGTAQEYLGYAGQGGVVCPVAPTDTWSCFVTVSFWGKYTLDSDTRTVIGPWSFHNSYTDWGALGNGMGDARCANPWWEQPTGVDCGQGFVDIASDTIFFSQPNSGWPINGVIGWIALDAKFGALLPSGTFSPYVWMSPRLIEERYTSTATPEPATWLTLASGLLLVWWLWDYRRMGVRKSSVTQSSPSGAR